MTYSVTDAGGKTAAATRLVNVVANVAPVITVLGDNPVSIGQGTVYTDAGATADDAEDGTLTASIETTNPVDPATPGEYAVTYSVTDSGGKTATAGRLVNVVANVAPVITVVGDNPVSIDEGDVYTDAGATAEDSEDGTLTASIETSNPVNTATPGEYTVTYSVTDSGGKTATVTRVVNVAATTATNVAPVITLAGANPLSIEAGSTYTEPGFTATDPEDGDLAAMVVTDSNVNAAEPGTYTITYLVEDSGGRSASVTRTVEVTSSARLSNMSTRGRAGSGDDVMIGGLILTGTEPTQVMFRGRGPSLEALLPGVDVLTNPRIVLFTQAGAQIASNDDWADDTAAGLIPPELGVEFADEAVLVRTLEPGAYTVHLSGSTGGTGVGIIEAFELNADGASLLNLSTRSSVGTDDRVLIGGLIIEGTHELGVTVRARGLSIGDVDPSLTDLLEDPVLELWQGQTLVASNDNWESDSMRLQIPANLEPGYPEEAALYRRLAPGGYTVIVRGVAQTSGIGIVEVFRD